MWVKDQNMKLKYAPDRADFAGVFHADLAAKKIIDYFKSFFLKKNYKNITYVKSTSNMNPCFSFPVQYFQS